LISLLSDQSQLVWLDGAGYWSADPATGAIGFLAERKLLVGQVTEIIL
jgi:hypothetical protein